MNTQDKRPAFASSSPQTRLLRIEAVVLAVFTIYTYRHLGGTWSFYCWMWLIPDIGMLAYVGGPRVGALAYNLTHNYVGGAVLFAATVGLDAAVGDLSLFGLIWMSHVAIDRAMGFGIKYGTGFRNTHLGRT